MVKLTPAQSVFYTHFRRVHGDKWFMVDSKRLTRVANNLVKKEVLERRYSKVYDRYEYRFVAGKNGKKYASAAMPVARTSVAYKSNEPDFQIGDYVRVKGNGARGTIQSLDRGDAILDTGKRFWTGELILLQKAAMECDVCGEIKTEVVTEHMDELDSFSICADCRAERDAINTELPGNSEQLPYTPDYDGWLQLVVDTADPSKPSIHFVRDWDRTYYVFASECDIVYEALKPFIAANPVKPVDPIPFAIDDDDNTVLRMVFQDWSPRKVPTFNDAMIALRNAGYRVVLADGEKVMKYDPSPKQPEAAQKPPEPQLHDGDEVFYGSACYKIAGEGIWKSDSYWYHIESHCGTAFVPESKIKLFAPNPERWIGHYALMKVSHHQEGNAKSWQEKVVVIDMKAGFAAVRRGTTHTRLHFRNLTLLPELATPEEMAAPLPTWDLPRIIRTDWTEVR